MHITKPSRFRTTFQIIIPCGRKECRSDLSDAQFAVVSVMYAKVLQAPTSEF